MRAFSAVSELFLSDVFPGKGETVEIRIAFSGEVGEAVLCHDSESGLITRVRMEYIGEERGAYWYSQKAKIFNSSERFTYFFCFRDKDDEPFYYGKNGIRRFSPGIHDRFILTPGVTYPEWIAGRTCYQILPDRFCDGDHSLDYQDGEYEFDSATVQALKFGEKPKYFNESRCLDFYSGDIPGMEEKLPYLREMGYDCIYTNPINCSLTLHRYDSTDFFHVDPHLGGDKAFEHFMKKAHGLGFRVIVDISINHTGTENPWFKSALSDPDSPYREFYYRNEDGSFRCWQGVPTLPQLNYNSQKLRDIIYRSAESCMQKYLREPYSIDGWRMDVAPEVARAGDDQLCHEVWRELHDSMKSVKRDMYIMGEAWDDSAEYLHGDEWDGIMNYWGAGRPLRCWMGEEDRFLSPGWGHSPRAIAPFSAKDTVDWLKDGLSTNEDQRNFMQMNLFDSHDTPRLHNHDEIMDDRVYLGVNLALYFLPGMPSTYYGDEIKIGGEMGSVEMSRYPMEWDGEKQDHAYKEWFRRLGEIRKLEGFALSPVRFEILNDSAFVMYRHMVNGTTAAAVINRTPEKISFGLDRFMTGENMEVLIGNAELKGGLNAELPPYESAAFLIR